MEIRVAIVDDDIKSVNILKDYIANYTLKFCMNFDISVYSDGDEITLNYEPLFDIIFMDIEMKLLDGMSAAEYIRKLDKEVIIIFITNMSQYAIKGYLVDALSFLLKPVPYFAFEQQLKKAVELIKKRTKNYYFIPTDTGIARIDNNDILYIESMGHKLILYTVDKEYAFTETMKDAEKKLKEYNFFRCNNGYLVNLSKVTGIKDNNAIVGGHILLISRPRKKAFMEALTKFYGESAL